jgi:hypothetical protein
MIKSQTSTSYMVYVKCIKDYKTTCKKGRSGFLDIVIGPAPIPFHWNQATTFGREDIAQGWVDNINKEWKEFFVAKLVKAKVTVDFSYKVNGSWT